MFACSGAWAQQHAVSYPSSPTLVPSSLSPEARRDLESLVGSQLSIEDTRKIMQRICPHAITRSAVRHDALRGAITEAKVAVTTELLFEKHTTATASLVDSFSLMVEFSPTRVLLRHMRPRFPSDLAGYSAPLSSDSTRPVRIEGEMGADLFILIPPARECGMQSLVVCPRRYEKVARLIPAPYDLKKMRVLFQAKADAVVAASSESPLKVMVSILGSPGMALPTEWFQTVSGTKTLSALKTISHDMSGKSVSPPFEPAGSLPISMSVESRIDIGNETSVLHAAKKRVNTEVSTIEIASKPNLLVGRSPLSIDGGQCYLLAQWSEEAL